MPAQWTASIIGDMHLNKIQQKELAEELGYTEVYTSMILNSHRDPPGAEEAFREALKRIIERKNTTRADQ